MKHYIVGDIHGYDRLLAQLIELIYQTIEEDDVIVFLGDYIDRGSGSKQVVDILLDLQTKHNVICLKGNHEQWMLESLTKNKNSWLMGMDGFTAVASYSVDFANELREVFQGLGRKILFEKEVLVPYYEKFFYEIMPREHLRFFEGLSLYYKNSDLLCVHAAPNLKIPIEQQGEEDLLWALPQEVLGRWQGEQTLIMGHQGTHQVDLQMWGKPIVTDNVVLMDTSCYETGVLSAICMPERLVIQARE